ncbi:MAG: TonB-dependent receptor, partial [Sphingomicrobium sp.]
MRFLVRAASGALFVLTPVPLFAAQAEEPAPASNAATQDEAEAIIVTATRTPTPITAIPSTVRVIDRQALDTQLAVSPSLLDSLAFSIPSLTPARQKLTSTSESLRGRTPLYL